MEQRGQSEVPLFSANSPPMTTLKPLMVLPLICLTGIAGEITPAPLTTLNFRGEALPVFAPPRLIHPQKPTAPRYPRKELAASVNGQAVVCMLVGTDGKVSEASVISSQPTPAFGEAALAAVKSWRFDPLTQDGRPTKFIVQQTVYFKMPPERISGPTMPIVADRYFYYEGFGRMP